jgi:hypothetical protein
MDSRAKSERLRLEAKVAIAKFVMIEIETARVFGHIAQGRLEDEKRNRTLENARQAFKIAEDWLL